MLSVIIPTHDPRPHFLGRVLEALRAQTLPRSEWELILVDNASPVPVRADLSWHPSGRAVVEPEVGLTRARRRGFLEAKGDLAILVDDDNVLDPGYLEEAAAIAASRPYLGTWSGGISLEFEEPSKAPPEVFFPFLTTRKVQRESWSNDPGHNESTPWGAGMCIRRSVSGPYMELLARDPRRARLDLQGKALVYGGDTDIAFTGCSLGFGKGVFPKLHMTHLIPVQRCAREHLLRSAEGQGYSELLHGYLMHGTVPGPRDDWAGRIGALVRRLRSSPDERSILDARERGYARARLEFSGEAGR